MYCIYVDMKVIAMKANIRSSNNNQIYGKVIYVYQIIILYKAFCVTVSTNFDTCIYMGSRDTDISCSRILQNHFFCTL